MKLGFYIICCLSICNFSTTAQTYKFESIGRQEGLSHSIITSMLQDKRGYMWFGTHDGLLRFDGYSFQVYRPESGNLNSIYDSWVTELFLDMRGRIWCRFESGGISVYDPAKEQFQSLLHDPNDPGTISNDFPPDRGVVSIKHSIVESRRGDLWIATSDGLNKLDPETLRSLRFYEGLETLGGLPGSFVTTLFIDDGNEIIWIGTDKGLCRMNLNTYATRHYTTNDYLTDNHIRFITKDENNVLWLGGRRCGLMRCELDESQNITSVNSTFNDDTTEYINKNHNVYDIMVAKDGDIWVGIEYGLFQISPDGTVIKNHLEGRHLPCILKVIEDGMGNIWAGGTTSNDGLFYFDHAENTLFEFDQKDQAFHGFSHNIINDLFLDASGVLWIGTGKGGLLRHNTFKKQFESCLRPHFKANSGSESEVYSIYVSESDKIYVGTKTSMYIFDDRFHLEWKHKIDKRDEKFNWNVIGAIEPVRGSQELWLGYFEGKISRFDPTRRTFNYFSLSDTDPDSFKGWSLRDILVASDGTTYFAPMSGGLIARHQGEKTFFSFNGTNNLPALETGPILCLAEGVSGKIWIGTNNRGVLIYDPAIRQVEFLKHSDRSNGISHNEVRAIHQASSGHVWIGTRYGLNVYDPGSKKNRRFFMDDGLPSNIIHGILEDDHGNIWLSTNMGISKFDTTAKRFMNYLEEDGLQGNEFNECAYFKDGRGMMYFGGTNGLTRFHPDSIKQDQTDPTVVLTGLIINQQNIQPGTLIQSVKVLDKSIDQTSILRLPYFLNNFSMYFSTLDFRVPKKVRYRYRLEGLDNEWQFTQPGEHSATYTWLPIGEYVFEVQASNVDGIWSSDTRSINVVVLPPWWKTTSFKLLFVALISTFIILIFIWNTRRLTRQRKLLEETVLERTRELRDVNRQLEAQSKRVQHQNEELQRHQEELKQHHQNIELLGEMGKKITASVELSDVFAQIYEIINKLMNINELMVGTVNRERRSLNIWGLTSHSEGFMKDQIPLNAKDRLSVSVIREKRAIFSNDLSKACRELLDHPHPKYFRKSSPKSGIYLPLFGPGNAVIGIMVALSYEDNAFTSKDISILDNLASYVSIAVENAGAYEKIKLQSAQLMEVDKIKTDFYTNVSHEFRTPLSLIQGPVLELMKSENKSVGDMKLLDIIKRNSNLLLNLVEKIMELSKIDGGVIKVTIQENCVSDQLKSISESFRHLAIQKSIYFMSEIPDKKVRGRYDYDILNKVCYNLLSNAIKYTGNGGKVVFSVNYEKAGIKIKVEDSGHGIPQHDLKFIFDRFYRGSLANEHQETGAGIGLALVCQLLKMIDGQIDTSSRYIEDYPENSGTTFTIWLPIESMDITCETNLSNTMIEGLEPESNGGPAENLLHPDKVEELLKIKILVVEDNRDLIEFLRDRLKVFYSVLTTYNANEALEMAKEEQPQLILSDVMMPTMSGIELCKAIKSDISISHIPVILITARDDARYQLEGLEAGASDCIIKPFKIDHLTLKIKNILENRAILVAQYRENIWTGMQDLANEISARDKEFLVSIRSIIEDQIQNPDLDVDYFCSELGVSRTWLYNKMKALLDMSMVEYIRNCRLKYGAKLLVTEGASVSQAAYACGFNDPKYFTRCFKKEFKVGPKAYCQLHQHKFSSITN